MTRGIPRIQPKENTDLRSWNVEKYTRLSDIRNNPMEVEGKPPDVLVAMLDLKVNLLMVCHNGRKLEEVCISPLRFAHDVICKENRVFDLYQKVDGRTNGKFRLRFPSTALCQSFCMFMSNFLQVVGYDEWFQNTNSQSSSLIMQSNSSKVSGPAMGSVLRNSSIGSVRNHSAARNERMAESSRAFDDSRIDASCGIGRKHANFRSDDNNDYEEAPLRQYPPPISSMVKGSSFAAPQLRRNSYQRLGVKQTGMVDVSCGETNGAGDYSFVEITKTSQNYSVGDTSPNFNANDTTTDGAALTNPSLDTETKISQNFVVTSQLDTLSDHLVENSKPIGGNNLVAVGTQTDPISVVQPNCVVNINIANLVSDEAAARFTNMCQSLITSLLKPKRNNSTLSKPRTQRKNKTVNTTIRKPTAQQVEVVPGVNSELEHKKPKVKKPLKWSKLNISVKRSIPKNRRKTSYRLRGNETPVKRSNPEDEEEDFSN